MTQDKILKIGMVVAMDKEITPFLQTDGKLIKKEITCGHEVVFYSLKGKELILIKSGIGEIQASSATSILIGVYGCNLILNFGVCGSLVDDIGVLNACVVKGVVHYDFDLSAIDNLLVGQYPDCDSIVIKTDDRLRELALSVNSELKEVVVGSADKFVADENIKKSLVENFNVQVCDMECAGILITANKAKVPCLILKAVSDGKGGQEEYFKRVKSASLVYIETLLKLVEIL